MTLEEKVALVAGARGIESCPVGHAAARHPSTAARNVEERTLDLEGGIEWTA
jgi:hypothetical protein